MLGMPAPARRARSHSPLPGGAGNRRFCMLSAALAHTEGSYKPDLLWETLRALNRPGRAPRTVVLEALPYRHPLRLRPRLEVPNSLVYRSSSSRSRGGRHGCPPSTPAEGRARRGRSSPSRSSSGTMGPDGGLWRGHARAIGSRR